MAVEQAVNPRSRYTREFFPPDLRELPNDNFLALSDLKLHERFNGITPNATLTQIVSVAESKTSKADACRAALEFTKKVFVALMHEDGRHINKEVVASANPKVPHAQPYQRVREVEDNWYKFATYTVWQKLTAGPRDNPYWIEQRASCLERKAWLEWLENTIEEIDIDALKAEYDGQTVTEGVEFADIPITLDQISTAKWKDLRGEIAPKLGVKLTNVQGKTKKVEELREDCIVAVRAMRKGETYMEGGE